MNEGIIWHIYRRQERGMIRGDDGTQVSFRKLNLRAVDFRAPSSARRVCCRIQEGWLGKEAVDVQPLPVNQSLEER
jgi:cold shock CspA family protein